MKQERPAGAVDTRGERVVRVGHSCTKAYKLVVVLSFSVLVVKGSFVPACEAADCEVIWQEAPYQPNAKSTCFFGMGTGLESWHNRAYKNLEESINITISSTKHYNYHHCQAHTWLVVWVVFLVARKFCATTVVAVLLVARVLSWPDVDCCCVVSEVCDTCNTRALIYSVVHKVGNIYFTWLITAMARRQVEWEL